MFWRIKTRFVGIFLCRGGQAIHAMQGSVLVPPGRATVLIILKGRCPSFLFTLAGYNESSTSRSASCPVAQWLVL